MDELAVNSVVGVLDGVVVSPMENIGEGAFFVSDVVADVPVVALDPKEKGPAFGFSSNAASVLNALPNVTVEEAGFASELLPIDATPNANMGLEPIVALMFSFFSAKRLGGSFFRSMSSFSSPSSACASWEITMSGFFSSGSRGVNEKRGATFSFWS